MRRVAFAVVASCACGSAAAQPPPHTARPEPTVIHGRVSFYGDEFIGRETANGERYDPALLTAASRTLPFGTRLRCKRIDSEDGVDRTVEVRINDRGPFGRRHPRILDLSRAAAEQLDMIARGVVVVRCRVLEWGRRSPRRRHPHRAHRRGH